MQPHDMDALVSSFHDVSDLETFSIPFGERDRLQQQHQKHDVNHIRPAVDSLQQRSSIRHPHEHDQAGEKSDAGLGLGLESSQMPINAPPPLDTAEQQEAKRPGISRSTYFRAKRNLKSHGGLRSSASTLQIGRPQKLDAKAEKVIQSEVQHNPGAELKHLQALVLKHCGISVSLSSISRRLKSLGCSPSKLPGESKKSAGKKARQSKEQSQVDALDSLAEEQTSPSHHEFDSIPHLEDYEAMQHAFAVNMRNHDLTGYTSDMNLDMLNLPADYGHLDHDALDADRTRHMYKYNPYDKDHDLNDYSPALNPDIYRHGDGQQMLFDEADLNNGTTWQEVLSSSSNP